MTAPTPQQRLLLWIFWSGITFGLLVVYFVIRDPIAAPGGPVGYVAIPPVFLSVLIRFVLLPKITGWQRGWPLFVIGMALAEGTALLGKFLWGPQEAAVLFGTALFVLLLYCPRWLPFYKALKR